jgi:hypothetical protein
MNWDTIQWFEVVWTAAAVPGLLLWIANRVLATRSLRAIKGMGTTNGRLIIARYSVMKCDVHIGVSAVFVLIGVVAMIRPMNPAAVEWDWSRVALTVGLLGAPAAISFLGYKWRAVEQQVMALARRRLDPHVEQNDRPVDPR